MTGTLHIRLAGPEDAHPLLDLYTHLVPDDPPCPIDQAESSISALAVYDGGGILLGEVEGTLLTSCTLIVIPNLTRGGAPYALIENVVTHSDHRGRGYGTQILNAASDRAWDHGCYKVMLSTGSTRPETHAFYLSAGFTQSRTGYQKRRVAPRAE